MSEGSPTWLEVARAASTSIAKARRGARVSALSEAVTALQSRWPELTLAKQTLRTALLAAAFVDEIAADDPAYARILERMPAIAVETIRRWHGHAPAAARREAVDYGAGRWSVRRLMKAERDARGFTAAADRSGRSGRSLFAADLTRSIVGYGVVGTTLQISSVELQKPDRSRTGMVPTDILSKVLPTWLTVFDPEMPGSEPVSCECALLIAGPYADATVAASRAADWMLRGLGLLFYFPKVALVLASSAAPRGFADAVPQQAQDRLIILADLYAKS